MNIYKHLVASGCSFSLTRTPKLPNESKGWPYWVAQGLNAQEHNTAMGSQGNDLIARKAIHKVVELLDSGVAPEEILVGIVWSGADRKDFYSSEVPADFPVNESGWIKNPEQFVEGNQTQGGWVIMSSGWMHQYSKVWYEHFYDEVGAHINTYERIHWTQSYLKSVGVNYFMTTYMSNVIDYMNTPANSDHTEFFYTCKDDPNIAWMHNSIDWTHFLPVSSYSAWCAANHSDFEDFYDHPHDYHAENFSNQVILPFVHDIAKN